MAVFVTPYGEVMMPNSGLVGFPKSPKRGKLISFTLVSLIACLAGCGHSGGGGNVDKEKQHILHVAELARDYETATKKKNEDFLKELDKDRNEKK